MDHAGARRPQPGGPPRARVPLQRGPARGRRGPAPLQALHVVRRHRRRRRASCRISSPTTPTIRRRSPAGEALRRHPEQARRDRARSSGCSSWRRRCRPRATCWRTIGSKAHSTARKDCCARLLANDMITANDAERLGLMLASTRRPLRRARRAHALRRDRQSGTQPSAASPCSTCWCRSATRPPR